MTHDRWERIQKLFQEALARELGQREAFLICACGNDAELRSEVESLLAHDQPTCDSANMEPVAGETATIALPSVEEVRRFPRVEGYEITAVLGHGGMGIVYQAVQTKLKRAVALKVLPAIVGAASPDAAARFRREAFAAARLHHTNIIPIYDFGESKDCFYYAMELITGRSLSEVIKLLAKSDIFNAPPLRATEILVQATGGRAEHGGSPSTGLSEHEHLDKSATSRGSSASGHGRVYLRQVARWVADVADALHYAHSQGIVHRDIKPDNLMLSRDGRIMVADFGLAKSEEEQSITTSGSLIGTLRFLSPEQAMGKRIPIDHRTDIYSLGATMYELLTFRPAFPGEERSQVLAAIIQREPVSPRTLVSCVPVELETICLKTLEKDPNARYSTAQELAADLRRHLDDMPIIAKPPTTIQRVSKFARRHRPQLISAIVVLAIVALSVGIRSAYRLYRGRYHYDQAVMYRAAGDGATAMDQFRRSNDFGYKRAWDALEQMIEKAKPSGTVTAGVSKNSSLDRLNKLALLEAAEHDWSSADEYFKAAAELEPRNVSVLCNYAIVKKDQYNALRVEHGAAPIALLEQALDLCDRALQIDPDDFQVLNTRGVVLKKLERYPEAVKAYGKAIELKRQYSPTWTNLGVVQALNRDFGVALDSLTQATQLTDTSMEGCEIPWVNLASLQLAQMNPKAFDSLGNAALCKKIDPWTSLLFARAKLQFPSQGTSESAYDDAVVADTNLGGENPWAKRVRAAVHLWRGEYEAAAEHARKALELEDLPSPNLFVLAIAAAKCGNQTEAASYIEQAQRAWPEDLRTPGVIHADAPQGILWFDTEAELTQLEAEALRAQGASRTP